MHIRTITFRHPDYAKVVDLRDAVLRRPLGLSIHNDDLSKDNSAIILVAEEEDEIIGCVLLQPQEDGVLRLRAMAVVEAARGKAVGRRLVAAAEEAALQYGAVKIILHARRVVSPFYQKLGYTMSGEPFTEVGIPHLPMQKDLIA